MRPANNCRQVSGANYSGRSEYVEKYGLMKEYPGNRFEMPDIAMVLVARFLEQGKGKFSERTKTKSLLF